MNVTIEGTLEYIVTILCGMHRPLPKRGWLCTVFWATVMPSCFLCGSSARAETYSTAALILNLNRDQATGAAPVSIRGVVTRTTDFGLYVQDRTAGIFVYWKQPNDFCPGDDVKVAGFVNPGLFAPVIMASTVTPLGRTHLPIPKNVTLKRLLTGMEDAQFVRITGIVRSVDDRPTVSPAQRLWLKIEMPDGFIFATMPEHDASEAKRLIGALIRIDGAATGTKNLNGQMTSVVLSAPGIPYVTVVHRPPKDLFSVPSLSMDRLLQYRSRTDPDHRIRVSGAVTYYRPGESLILEQGSRAILVMTVQRSDIKLGDYIDAAGFPSFSPSGPFLQDAVFRCMGHGDPPKPIPVSVATMSSGVVNNNLVSFDGKLLHQVAEPNDYVLLVQNGSTLVRASLDDVRNAAAFKRIPEGSIVRISGISVVDVEGSWNVGGPTASAIRYKVLLRSPDDVQEIEAPSWWTAAHLLVLLAVFGVLTLTLLVLTLYGRMRQTRLEAVVKERERLANEIHDTLAQSFAGIGFQLQAIRRAIPATLPEVRQQVDFARELVRHSHKEARRSIQSADPESIEDLDLCAALETAARRLVEGGSVEVEAKSVGRKQALPKKIRVALLRIGLEAVANAVRHASPSRLDIALNYGKDFVRLIVKDDGCGFEDRGDLLGFGLRSMRKRSASIGARLQILSTPGGGTQVLVDSPLPPAFFLFSQVKRKWRSVLKTGAREVGKQQRN